MAEESGVASHCVGKAGFFFFFTPLTFDIRCVCGGGSGEDNQKM